MCTRDSFLASAFFFYIFLHLSFGFKLFLNGTFLNYILDVFRTYFQTILWKAYRDHDATSYSSFPHSLTVYRPVLYLNLQAVTSDKYPNSKTLLYTSETIKIP